VKWPMVKLGEVCERVSVGHVGTTSEFYTDSSGIPFLRTQNINSEGLVFDEVKYITSEFHQKLKKSTLAAGDVILSRVVSSSMNCGIVPAELNGANCANIILARPHKNVLCSQYLLYYLRSENVQRSLMSRQVGSAQSVVNTGVLKDWEIPLPPLAEQQCIAAILYKADAIRRKRQQAIQLADDFLRAVFLDMFGDPVTNPKGWEVLTFGEIGALDRGKSKHRPRNDPKLLGGDHPLIQTGDVASSGGYIKKYKSTYSDLGLYQSKKWPEGTLCITIAANIAKTGVLKFDACFPDSIVGFTPNERTTVEYVQYWLGFLQKTLEANAPESAQKNINLAILRELEIPLPDIDLQRKFSEVIQKAVSTADKLSGSSEVQVELFNSLSQKAFAGEL
jgi:type I restriction enzyme, S subunit